MTRSLLISLVLLLMMGAGGTLAAEALRVGLSPDYPPLVYKQDERVVGIEADNARAVGEILGRPVSLVEMPFGQLIPALKSGRIDVIMSGLSATAERSREVTFTDAYLRVGQMAILHKDKVARFAQPWSIYREGIRIGVEPGTTGDAFARRELPDARIVNYDNSSAAFEGLRRDEIDLYIHDAPTSWQLAQSMDNDDLISLYAPLTEEMLAWAVRQEDAALAAELNQALALMKSNGTLQYILNRWIPVKIEVR
jgi:ABC-type amino acid transport substrate-binding protein